MPLGRSCKLLRSPRIGQNIPWATLNLLRGQFAPKQRDTQQPTNFGKWYFHIGLLRLKASLVCLSGQWFETRGDKQKHNHWTLREEKGGRKGEREGNTGGQRKRRKVRLPWASSPGYFPLPCPSPCHFSEPTSRTAVWRDSHTILPCGGVDADGKRLHSSLIPHSSNPLGLPSHLTNRED